MKISRAFILVFIVFFHTAISFCYENGGMLCGEDNAKPVWILRFEIRDKDTHMPVRHTTIRILDSSGRSISWEANRDGVGVFVAISESCLPSDATLEIASEGYKYHTEQIERDYFERNKENYRILLEGHRHKWTSLKQIPSTEELIDKIIAKRYAVGVKRIPSGMGFDWVNYAPPCYEFTFELESRGGQNESSREPRRERSYERDEDRGEYGEQPGELLASNCRYIVLPEDGCYRVIPLNSDFNSHEFCQEMGHNRVTSAELIQGRITGRVKICCERIHENNEEPGTDREHNEREKEEERSQSEQSDNRKTMEEYVSIAQQNGSGIAARNLTRNDRETINRAMGQVWYMIGVVVAYINPESPAYRAGLREGMIISNVWTNNTSSWAPTDAESFDTIMQNRKRGDKIRLAIWRQSEGNNIKAGYAGSEEKGKWYQDEITFEF